MGNYSDDPASVEVVFFKESGKYYTTEAVKWTGPYHSTDQATGKITLLGDAFAQSLADHFAKDVRPPGDTLSVPEQQDPKRRWRLEDMVAVCLEPYHEHGCPIMVRVAHAKRAYEERIKNV